VDDELTRWEHGQAALVLRAERAGRVLQHMHQSSEARFLPHELTIPLALTDAEVEDGLADLREAGYVRRADAGEPGYIITAAGIAAVVERNRGPLGGEARAR
jgi:hypothetical protein